MNFGNYFYLLRYSIAKKGAIKAYKNALISQHLDESELEELSWQKTKKLLTHAYEHVPWYTNTFKKNDLHPNDISKPEYYAQVPILRRQDIINNFEKFIAKGTNSNDLNFITTGGSSGEPLKIGVNKHNIREVQKWQMLNWWDIPFNSNMASFYRGLPIGGIKAMALGIINWPQKVIRVDATEITPDKIKDFINNYKSIKPKIIHGYVGALDSIADYILEQSISFSFSPRVIWSTAAPISKVQENKISKAFNAPICDQYGCSEIYFIASECTNKKGLHVFSNSRKVEIVDSKYNLVENGELGKIVITNLDEYTFPLIRYENGDMSRMLVEKCNCGITYPLMDKVRGRESDNFILPTGRILAGEYLTTIFDNHSDKVRQFQLVQKKDLSIIVNVVMFHEEDLRYIENVLKSELGILLKDEVEYSLNLLNEIPHFKGKVKFIIKE